MFDEVAAVSALGDPSRRALYDFVVQSGDWVSRDQAADGVGLERGNAAHHLDRLAAEGLLEIEYRRLTGRQGPGAGRPAKVYRRARRDLDVSLPPRDYALAARLLAEAGERSQADGSDFASALDAVASDEGARLGERLRAALRGPAARRSAAARRRALMDVLQEKGFEPTVVEGGTIVLRNCPFHQLAKEHTDLVCGMNLCMLSSAMAAAGASGAEVRLDPEEGLCCVKVDTR